MKTSLGMMDVDERHVLFLVGESVENFSQAMTLLTLKMGGDMRGTALI